ncbi:hypothetical protein Ahy_A06g030609 isoform A [Arachis hypogaea]|uniref:Uncharacterized protein n=1 Tax=Arachis hypogaea TaxID=3818 RepID=A0A445CWR7_ARAHY|nr:hypothetical protein Ahy_A06g030609 isoform A [Arachis hypogaea]
MATSASCSSTESALMTKTLQSSRRRFRAPIGLRVSMPRNPKLFNRIRASMVDSSSDFVSRIEKTWLISQVRFKFLFPSCAADDDNIKLINLIFLIFCKKNLSCSPEDKYKGEGMKKTSKDFNVLEYKFSYLFLIAPCWSLFSKTPDVCSNHGQLFVRLATQRGILNANGVGVLVSSLLVTKCSVKFHRKIPAVLFAMARRDSSCHYFVIFFQGSMCCSDCQGTGFRAKWLEEPPTSK